MVSIETKNGDAIISVLGWHRFWTLKKTIYLKKEQIQSVRMADRNLNPPWLRWPGTCLLGFICAGTYYGKGRKEFWDTTYKGNAIQIDLKGGSYTRIVVDVENPNDIIGKLTSP